MNLSTISNFVTMADQLLKTLFCYLPFSR